METLVLVLNVLAFLCMFFAFFIQFARNEYSVALCFLWAFVIFDSTADILWKLNNG